MRKKTDKNPMERNLSFALPDSMKERLQRAAETEKRTMSQMARILIASGLDAHQHANQPDFPAPRPQL